MAKRSVARRLSGCALAAAALSAHAIPFNPLDPTLPLSEHAWVSCPDGLNSGFVNTGDVSSACIGGYTVLDQATLSHADGSGTGSADLRTGQLKAVGTGQSIGNASAPGGAIVKLYDTLTVQGQWSGTLPVVMHLNIDGNFLASRPGLAPASATAVSTGLMLLTDAGVAVDVAGVMINTDAEDHVYLLSSTGDVTPDDPNHLFDPLDTRVQMTARIALDRAHPSFSFVASLGVTAGPVRGSAAVDWQTVDFGNTAQLSVELPPGYQYTSDSGVFLSAVPEPGSAWLFTAGLLPLAPRLRRRRAGAAALIAWAACALPAQAKPTPAEAKRKTAGGR